MPSFASAIFREDKEQAILADYLPATGFFVEVGAFDPVVFSQTWAVEQRGWDGLLIEPVPAQAHALRARRRARVIEAAYGPARAAWDDGGADPCRGTQSSR